MSRIPFAVVVAASLLMFSVSSATAQSIGAGTGIELEVVDTPDGGPRINVDESYAVTLDAGVYQASSFSFAAGQDGDAIPFLATLTGDNPNEYEIIALGSQVDITGSPVTTTVPFGGANTFSLPASTTVFAGFTNSPDSPHNPVYLDNNTPETTDHDNDIEAPITAVGQLIGSPSSPMSHADLGRTYAFAVDVQQVTTPIIHRWSFGETEGTTVADSIGGAHGEIKGDGGALGGGQVTLPGGPSDSAAYVDLPNGLISGLTDTTVEGWITVDGNPNWQRVFDFGSSEGGEVEGPGGGGEGQDYFMLSAGRGDNVNQQRFELRNLDPAFGGADAGTVDGAAQNLDTDTPTTLGEQYHFAAVYDADGDNGSPQIREYRNGELTGSASVSIELGNINDVNNWLGRSNWVNDANFQGSYNEFRIYDEALDDAAVSASFEAGPDMLVPEPSALILSALGLIGLVLAGIRRRTRSV